MPQEKQCSCTLIPKGFYPVITRNGMPLYTVKSNVSFFGVSILSSPGMVCHTQDWDYNGISQLFLSCHHQEWYATDKWRERSIFALFLSCHHQEWYATWQPCPTTVIDLTVSILSSPGMVCHPQRSRRHCSMYCFYPVITRNGMPLSVLTQERSTAECFYPVITRNGMPHRQRRVGVDRRSFYPVITRNGMPP